MRKPADCNCCRGLEVDGEKLLSTDRSLILGMFTGAELPSKPELASPADIELLIGELVSLCIESTKLNGSSRCMSSNALPEKIVGKKMHRNMRTKLIGAEKKRYRRDHCLQNTCY